MEIESLDISELKLISPKVFRDERGFFFESYREELYRKHEIAPFVQDNISFSHQNTLRGLHFSSPGQAKLVSCLKGEIWDVAVDIRSHSSTFMQYRAVLLNDQNCRQFYIPVGFAHGFCVLSESAMVQYKVSIPYDAKTERSIRWNDPELAISWPVKEPVLSLRDLKSPFFKDLQCCG